MKGRIIQCSSALLLGIAMAVLLLWANATTPVNAASNTYCVNQTGHGCNIVCGGGCYNSVQDAIDDASSASQIRVAGGTYTETIGTVAVVTKSLSIIGGFDQPCGDGDFSPRFNKTTLDGQSAGSVISITNAGNVSLQYLTVQNGYGADNLPLNYGAGGGIWNETTNLTVSHLEITHNEGGSGVYSYGGGIYSVAPSDSYTVTIEYSKIISNVANTCLSGTPAGNGGGIYILNGNLILKNSFIMDNLGNYFNSDGCGVYLYYLASAEITNNIIKQNCTDGVTIDGVGLFINHGNVLLKDNLIEENVTGSGHGGGLYSQNADIEITGNRILSNTSSWGGGGAAYIVANADAPVTITNNLIAQNESHANGHSCNVFLLGTSNPADKPQVIMVNNTFADNNYGAIAVYDYVNLTMKNNILTNNDVGIYANEPSKMNLLADTNLFFMETDNYTGTNAITGTDPILDTDYHLQDGSPAIDVGLTIPWLNVDLEGVSRPQGTKYDLGAFEFVKEIKIYLPFIKR
jgi:hypothetical protein